jgi:hypothetical protein
LPLADIENAVQCIKSTHQADRRSSANRKRELRYFPSVEPATDEGPDATGGHGKGVYQDVDAVADCVG